jgi:uncharacterized delta-60 repeat protein
VTLPDGKILLGGTVGILDGRPGTNLILRLNFDGSVDPGFNVGVSGQFIHALSVQLDGKILVGGVFSLLGKQPRINLGRLNSDGTLDTSLVADVDGSIQSLASQADGKIVVAGMFRRALSRFSPIDAAVQKLEINEAGTMVTFLRGGASPEVLGVRFQESADGTNWIYLGDGTRIPGGWRLIGLDLRFNSNRHIRALGSGSSGSIYLSPLLFYNVPPRLEIGLIPSGLHLSWPAAFTNFSVFTRTNLDSQSLWLSLPQAPSATNDELSITVPRGVGGEYFRLRKL